MSRKNGFTLVEIIVVITILGILFGLGIPSYRFIIGSVKERQYENKISYALAKAVSWANDTGRDVTNIAHLIEEGYMEPDDESGAYDNPVDDTSMLCYTIRVDYNNNQYEPVLTEERYCAYEELERQTSIIELVKYDSNGQVVPEDEWTRSDILLRVQFKDEVLRNTYQNSVEEIVWKGNDKQDTVLVNGDFSSKNQYQVQASKIMNAKYEVTMKLVYEGKTYIYKAYTKVKIDRQEPIIYQDDTTVEDFNEWKNQNKSTRVVTSDYDGSGIYGYYINNNISSCGTNKSLYQKVNQQVFDLSLNQGEYFACVMDNVGNVSSPSKITVIKVDIEKPKLESFTIHETNSNPLRYYNKLIIKTRATDTQSGVSNVLYCMTTGGDCTPNIIVPVENNDYVYVTYKNAHKNAQKVCAIAYDKAGNASNKVCSSGYLFDNTAPSIFNPSTSLSNLSYTAKYGGNDNESGITSYKIYRTTNKANYGNPITQNTTSTSSSYTYPAEREAGKRYFLKVVVTNGSGLTVQREFEYTTKVTMDDARKFCKINAWGYCDEGVYVKWFDKMFVLMKGSSINAPVRSVYGVTLEEVNISLIMASCCDQGYCHYEHIVGAHSGIWGTSSANITLKDRMFNYFENKAGDVSKYLNIETYTITKNIIVESMGGGKVEDYGHVSVDAYFGLLTMDDARNMITVDFLKDYMPRVRVDYGDGEYGEYVTTLVSAAFMECTEKEHYACAENPDNIMATAVSYYLPSDDKPRALEVEAVAGPNNSFLNDTDHRALMSVPFKSEIDFSSGNGTYQNPFVIRVR